VAVRTRSSTLLNLSQVRMAHGNYNAKQIVDYWDAVFEKLQSPTKFDYFVHKLWWKVWKAAEHETTLHRKQGTFSGPNSLGLLKLKTNAADQSPCGEDQGGRLGFLDLLGVGFLAGVGGVRRRTIHSA